MQPPRVTATRIVYENRWMRLHEDTTERADGTPGLYAWVEKPPAAVIVPVDEGSVWLVEQHRHPIGSRFWELPQGAWEDDPSAAAEDHREDDGDHDDEGDTASDRERTGRRLACATADALRTHGRRCCRGCLLPLLSGPLTARHGPEG